MKTEDIINLDYREEKNREVIQKALKRIKPLEKFSEENVPIEAIEKLIHVMCKKYEITPQWMSMSFNQDKLTIYSIGIKTTNDHKWLGTVFGMCVYEVFAKLGIKMYSEVKRGKVKRRNEE